MITTGAEAPQRSKISGCTPEVASNLSYRSPIGPFVTRTIEALADQHEHASQDNLSVIGPIHPSGKPYGEVWTNDGPDPRVCDLDPATDIRVLPHCTMGDSWEFGFVDGPPPNKEGWNYLVSYGCHLMVQTYALDIMALATRGRMTPLRLWRLAMQQGFEGADRPTLLEGVEYGDITGQCEQFPNEFPGLTTSQLLELEEIGDLDTIKQRMVHEGYFWLWMAADRFPTSPMKGECFTTVFAEAQPFGSRSAIENLPPEVLTPIVSHLTLATLLNLTSASRSLRMGVFGNDYLARVWTYNNAPWWIPVPTQTLSEDVVVPQAFLASSWSTRTQLTVDFPADLDWAYIMRCSRSGSMRNRRRIWNAALDIESVADQSGV